MTLELEEAIKYMEKVAEENERLCKVMPECAEAYYCAKKYRQLAEWLRELKERRKVMDFINSNVRVIETNEGVMIRFCGGNVCEWAKRNEEVNADERR